MAASSLAAGVVVALMVCCVAVQAGAPLAPEEDSAARWADEVVPIGEAIVALREKWHTKNHPFFQKMTDGSLDLRPLGQKSGSP